MQKLQNMYFVRTGAPATEDPEGPFMPLDVHTIIERHVFQAEQARRYAARVLRFRFDGYIDPDLCIKLSLAIVAWGTLNQWRAVLINRSRRRLAFIERRTKANVLPLLLSLFRSNNTDIVNITNELHWTQEDFNIRAGVSTNEIGQRCPTMWLMSKDGLHHIQFMLNVGFLNQPAGQHMTNSQKSRVSIWYYGPQRFNTGGVDEEHLDLVYLGGIQEYVDGEHVWPTPLQEIQPRVFENWQAIGT